MVRPEEIEIQYSENTANAQISDIEFFGHDALIHLELNNKMKVSSRIAAPVKFKVGDKVLAKQKGPIRFFEKND